MEFKPIEPEGLSDRELLEAAARGVNQVHRCVDEFRRKQGEHNDESRAARKALGRRIGGLETSVGKLKTSQTVDGGRIDRLSELFGVAKDVPAKPPKVSARLGWQEHLKVLGLVGGTLGLLVFLYKLIVAVFPALHAFLMTVTL